MFQDDLEQEGSNGFLDALGLMANFSDPALDLQDFMDSLDDLLTDRSFTLYVLAGLATMLLNQLAERTHQDPEELRKIITDRALNLDS